MKARFQKHSAVYTCIVCGEQTRDTGRDEAALGLCAQCLYQEYMLNVEADFGKDSPQYRAAELQHAELMATQA